MMLSLLAIVFAVIGAFATVNGVSVDDPIRHDFGSPCIECSAADDPEECGGFVQGYVRCECTIPDGEGGSMLVPAENVLCQELWKPAP